MLLCEARGGRHAGRVTARRSRPHGSWLSIAIAVALAAGACRRAEPPGPDVHLTWTLDPTPPRVGRATLTLTLRGDAGAPEAAATVRIEGHMSHPGMPPILAVAAERAPGVYGASFDLPMAGDWILLVRGVLSDGRRVERRIDLPGVRPAT